MPEYEHVCKSCGHEFSVRKPLTQATRREECPKCQGETKRRWGAVGIGRTSATGCEPGSRFT